VRFIDEFRDGGTARAYIKEIGETITRPWTIMEICGGQTHTIVKSGIDRLLPPELTLASRGNVIFTSFGDMLRVPGSEKDLLTVKARGGDVRIVYSPLDAVELARQNPDKKVVFFAVGFETTAPANAMSVLQAKKLGLKNYFILCSHVLVPPAIQAILSSPSNRIQGFLAAGHVCTVMGYEEYIPLAEKYRIPIVVTGFEPVDILQGILMTVKQLEEGTASVENQYTRAVKREGNLPAKKIIKEIFRTTDRSWRGIGNIPLSGYSLRDEFSSFDAEMAFDVTGIKSVESGLCIAGEVLRGLKKPVECPAFASLCTPEHPLGAPMVSSEGACAAYYRYGRKNV
jgi:hydrogenase expression/formation protein HypD